MSVRAKVNLKFGHFTTDVAVNGAMEGEVPNRTVCRGSHRKPHEAVRITQPTTCEHCGPIRAEQTLKAREVDGTLVVLDPELLAIIKDVKDFNDEMRMNPHPADQVELNTVPGDKIYYLSPLKGHEANYLTMAFLIQNHPEVTFLVRWAPRTRVGVFKISAIEGEAGPVLVMFERVAASRVRAAPVIRTEESSAEMTLLLEAAETVLTQNRRARITKFEPNAYMDTTEDRIQELIRGTLANSEGPKVNSGLLALQKMIDEGKPAPRTRKPKAVKEEAA